MFRNNLIWTIGYLLSIFSNVGVNSEVLPCITYENTAPTGPENQVCMIGEDSKDQNIVYFLVTKQVPFTDAETTCASAGVKISRDLKDIKLITTANPVVVEDQYGGEQIPNPVWTALTSVPNSTDPVPVGSAVALGESGYSSEDQITEMQALCQANKS